jgi:hypothetical protein
MNIEYLIIGVIYFITSIAIIIYKFKDHTIKEEKYTGLNMAQFY